MRIFYLRGKKGILNNFYGPLSPKGATAMIFLVLFLYLFLQTLWPQLPMRWPDEIVFYVGGMDLVEKGVWHLPVFSYLDPSYDQSNFNTMPLYSLLFYLWLKVTHIKSTEYFNYFQILFSISTLYVLYRWMEQYRPQFTWRKVLCWALFISSPILYYNMQIIRPEPVIYVLASFLFYILWRYPAEKILKQRIPYLVIVSSLLCVSAYLHYNAILFVIIVLIFLARWAKSFFQDIALIALFCLIGLLPWIFLVLSHGDAFMVHFLDQTTRIYAEKSESFSSRLLLMYHNVNMCGLRKSDPFFKIFLLQHKISIIFFAVLAIVHFLARTLTPFVKRMIVCCLVSIVFVAYHREAWFGFYYEFILLISSFFMLLDLKGRILPCLLSTFAGVFAVYSLFVMLFIMATYPKIYYSSDQFDEAVECLNEGIPDGTSLVVNALPDPSVPLLVQNPSLKIFRMIDYPTYAPEWSELVDRESYFITANYSDSGFDGRSHIHFDHDDQLAKKIRRLIFEKRVVEKKCMAGQVPIYLFHMR